ncbi:BTB/POZ protein [Apiospora arundinis]|uniref:BTB/POZ protein n=1 Tax=Apiospora arundinis TaxID=335852 RepID=A0ABR2I3C7_9PEZI
MLKSGEFADAEVECRGRTWAVHKVIVCGRSQWFDRAFRGNFKEATDSKVVIHDEDPDHIDWLLRYIYGGVAPLFATAIGPLLENLGTLHGVKFVALCMAHRLGDYYDVAGLPSAAIASIRQGYYPAINFFQRQGSPWRMAYFPWEPEMYFFSNFFAGIGAAYEMEYPAAVTSLQETFVNFVLRTRYLVLARRAFSSRIQNHPKFAARIMQLLCHELTYQALHLGPNNFPDRCSKCKRDNILQTGGHFAQAGRPSFSRYEEGICSDCEDTLTKLTKKHCTNCFQPDD